MKLYYLIPVFVCAWIMLFFGMAFIEISSFDNVLWSFMWVSQRTMLGICVLIELITLFVVISFIGLMFGVLPEQKEKVKQKQ